LFNKFYVLCVTLCFFFFKLLFNKFYMCVDFYYKFYVFFYYKFILTWEFIKHDKVNYLCCDIRYLDLHFSLGCLIRCMYKFFYLHVGVFICVCVCVCVWRIWWRKLFGQCLSKKSLKALGALRLFSFRKKNYLLRWVFKICIILILYIRSKQIDRYIKYFCKHLTKLFRSLQ
jgi:hypothetical protein